VPLRPPRLALAALAAATLAAATPAPAVEVPPPGGIFDLQGARAMGSSAATAGSTGTEALFVNPGAMGVRAGYVAELLGVSERRGATTTSRYLGVAVVDAVSAPVTTSFAYLASTEGEQRGQLFFLGFGGAISERMHLGVQGRYLKLGGAEPIGAVTADAGLSWEATSLVTLGVAGFNLVPSHHPVSLPQSMGAGLAVGTDTFLRVLADWRGTFLPHGQLANRYAVGAVGLVGGTLALRAGWMRDELLDTRWWSSGVGLVTGDGYSIDVGYRQSIQAAAAREMALSFRYYPPQ
jgi:hypothetical protein